MDANFFCNSSFAKYTIAIILMDGEIMVYFVRAVNEGPRKILSPSLFVILIVLVVMTPLLHLTYCFMSSFHLN